MEESSKWGLPLPWRISRAIFSKVPISNLPACRLVCKSWNCLILGFAAAYSPPKGILFATHGPFPDFPSPKIHCFDIPTLSFVASCTFSEPGMDLINIYNYCNGLLFLEKSVGNGVYREGIFNPMTHEFFQIPICELHRELYQGFGFSRRRKQYKLFRADSVCCEFKVLRFGRDDNQWMPVCLPSPITLDSHGVYMDGVVYWTGKEKDNEYLVYGLDVETEKFKVITVLRVGPHSHRAILRPFNGTIYAIVFMNKPSQIQVWRMRKSKKDSWIRDFIVLGKFSPPSIDLVKAYKDGKVILRITNDLFWLDRKSRRKIKRINHIKTLIPSDRHCVGTCFTKSLHFGSLSRILVGHD